MVRKVGFGDDDTGNSGQVVRGEPDRQEKPPSAPASNTSAPPALPARPRWGSILFLMLFLVPWLGMIGMVVTGILRRASGITIIQFGWVGVSLLGTAIIIRKLVHFYRGGTWLQTPDDIARKARGGDA